ncbi:MAG: hypothetical protein OXF02_04790 [Simkaniaceae bacterium]|nr:hypothetical protein [Simkaniaceae bacterium]
MSRKDEQELIRTICDRVGLGMFTSVACTPYAPTDEERIDLVTKTYRKEERGACFREGDVGGGLR